MADSGEHISEKYFDQLRDNQFRKNDCFLLIYLQLQL
jgi:hypothetical protein